MKYTKDNHAHDFQEFDECIKCGLLRSTIEEPNNHTSACCGAEVIAFEGDDGTNHWTCKKCGEACDIAPAEAPKGEDCACHEPHISGRVKHTKEKCYVIPAPKGEYKGTVPKDVRDYVHQEFEKMCESYTRTSPAPNTSWEERLSEVFEISQIKDSDEKDSTVVRLGFLRGAIEHLFDVFIKTAKEEGYEEGRKTDNQIPMGASQWKNHGIKYGYWNYFKEQAIANDREEIKREINVLLDKKN